MLVRASSAFGWQTGSKSKVPRWEFREFFRASKTSLPFLLILFIVLVSSDTVDLRRASER